MPPYVWAIRSRQLNHFLVMHRRSTRLRSAAKLLLSTLILFCRFHCTLIDFDFSGPTRIKTSNSKPFRLILFERCRDTGRARVHVLATRWNITWFAVKRLHLHTTCSFICAARKKNGSNLTRPPRAQTPTNALTPECHGV